MGKAGGLPWSGVPHGTTLRWAPVQSVNMSWVGQQDRDRQTTSTPVNYETHANSQLQLGTAFTRAITLSTY
jgi:hypothetical protein